MIAVTLDQQHSRRDEDRVPQALELVTSLLGDDVALPAERTAGDEVQLLLTASLDAVRLVEAFTRCGGWWLGLGVGAVDTPLPDSTRAARGPAYLAARRAVERAKRAPHGCALEVEATTPVGGGAYRGDMQQRLERDVADTETAVWLHQSLLAHRSAEGWQVVDLLDQGLSVAEAAARLGISSSAVSQRHQRAGREVAVRGRALCTHLLDRLQQAADPAGSAA